MDPIQDMLLNIVVTILLVGVPLLVALLTTKKLFKGKSNILWVVGFIVFFAVAGTLEFYALAFAGSIRFHRERFGPAIRPRIWMKTSASSRFGTNPIHASMTYKWAVSMSKVCARMIFQVRSVMAESVSA